MKWVNLEKSSSEEATQRFCYLSLKTIPRVWELHKKIGIYGIYDFKLAE